MKALIFITSFIQLKKPELACTYLDRAIKVGKGNINKNDTNLK